MTLVFRLWCKHRHYDVSKTEFAAPLPLTANAILNKKPEILQHTMH